MTKDPNINEENLKDEASQENSEDTKDTENKEAEAAAEEAKADDAGEKSPEDEAMETKYLRLMADFQNYKRRSEKEKDDIYAFANEKIVSELLNVIDNFERALEHSNDPDDSFAQGMKMIYDQMLKVLEKANVKEIEALGVEFDPNLHNAVMMEDNDEFESGIVSGVMQKGYTLNGRVVRPSMVKVAN